jgi:putative methylase
MQKRLVRKLDLELFLSRVKSHPSPNPKLEQYMTPTDVAATILYIAAYTNHDITDRSVLDLGCGTGKLALGAAFLGAREVVGVDLDRVAIKVAQENSVATGLKGIAQWVAADVDSICGKSDTVVQNPPFGVQKRNADRVFLSKALEVGRVIYSIHKSLHNDQAFIARLKMSKTGIMPVSPSPFLENLINRHGGKIKAVYALEMVIPHMFSFHTEKKHEFVVDLYIIEGKGK